MRKFDRLQRLYALHGLLVDLAKHPEKKFNMRRWAKTEEYVAPGETPRRCNSTACALGSAGFEAFFRERGLKTEKTYYALDVVLPREGHPRITGYLAGAEFFGITRDESDFLFNPDHYRVNDNPLLIAKRVVKLIKQYS